MFHVRVMLHVNLNLLWGQWDYLVPTHHHSIVFTKFLRTYTDEKLIGKDISLTVQQNNPIVKQR